MTPTPRTVLYVLPQGEPGGAERATLLMLSHHDPARYRPSVFFLNDGSFVARVRELGIPVHLFGGPLRFRKPWQLLAAVRQCRDVIRREGIDVVHSCGAYAHVIAAPAAQLAGVPSCLFEHGPIGGGMLDRAASLVPTARVMTNSEYTRRCHDRAWLRHVASEVVPLATEISLTRDEEEEHRRHLNNLFGLVPGDIALGMMARFEPWKGIDFALHAAAPLLRDNPRVKFLLVGGPFRGIAPGYESQLRRIAADEKIEKQVIFCGVQKDPLPYLSRIDILINASRQPEPFGLSIIEAMAARKAVVVPREGGPLEIVTDGSDGIFFHPPSSDDLGAKLRRLAGDRELRQGLGGKAVETVDRAFRPARMMERMMGVYDSMLSPEASSRRQ